MHCRCRFLKDISFLFPIESPPRGMIRRGSDSSGIGAAAAAEATAAKGRNRGGGSVSGESDTSLEVRPGERGVDAVVTLMGRQLGLHGCLRGAQVASVRAAYGLRSGPESSTGVHASAGAGHCWHRGLSLCVPENGAKLVGSASRLPIP